jgi:hypothetical protein
MTLYAVSYWTNVNVIIDTDDDPSVSSSKRVCQELVKHLCYSFFVHNLVV